MKETKHWATHLRTTANHSIANLLKDANARDRASGGQAVRLLDQPQVPEEGCFQNLHGFSGAGAFATALGTAASTHYGTAGREFIKKFVQNKEALRDVGLRIKADFAKDACHPGCSGQVHRVANNFGLIAAAGELAILFGILPWPKGEAYAAVMRTFEGWIKQRGGYGDHEAAVGVRAVKEFIEAKMLSCFVETREAALPAGELRVPQTIAGYIVEIDNQRIFALTAGGFRTGCAGGSPQTVAAALAEKGLLIREDRKHLTRKVHIVAPIGKDSIRPRLYCIRDAILNGEER